MRDQLNRFPMTSEAGHTALNIGLRDEVEQHLASQRKNDQDEQSSDDQFRFRLARMDGARNPYKELIPSCHHSNVCRFVAEAAQSQTPLAVQLFGGLGDQLELLSLVLPWSSRHCVPLRLIAEEQRCRLLDPCCLTTPASNLSIQKQSHPSLRAWPSGWECLSMTPPAASQPGFKARRTTSDPHQMVCCWRAEGRGSSLSAHSRSVPFSLVHSFYQRLMEQEPETAIVDITAWQPWEMQRLQQLGVTLQNPVNLA